MLNGPGVRPWLPLPCGVIGLVTAFLFVWITQYYTESRYRPVQSIAEASLTGPATNIISGLAVGMETPAMPGRRHLRRAAAQLLLRRQGPRGVDLPGISNYAKGIYGTAIATMGMLSCAAYILAMDTFGPITDNAGGIIEMSNQPDSVRDRTDKLDSAGNTTKALTKGYAIGSASLAAFLLFSAYLEEIKSIVTARVTAAGPNGFMPPAGPSPTSTSPRSPSSSAPARRDAHLPLLSLAIKAVGRTAQMVVKDVRDQFRENPGIMAGTSKPDYARCVSIVTGAPSKRWSSPASSPSASRRRRPHLPQLQLRLRRHLSSPAGGLSTVPTINGIPVNLGGATAVAGLLMVGTISGVLLAMLMNNGGGAWDNAKKWIETGKYGGKNPTPTKPP
jgi:K(+)-stimulated pyrophosphate-energized sodium pump